MKTIKTATLAVIAPATVAATIGLAPPAYAAGLDYSFHSPTGNIRCEMYIGDDGNNSQVVCVEDDHTWVAPSRPLACQANDHWGNALSLDPQFGAGVVCYQGTPQTQLSPLPRSTMAKRTRSARSPATANPQE